MTYIPRSSPSLADAAGPIPKMVRKKHTFRVFHILATTLFVLSIIGALGLFFLTQYAETQLVAAKDKLAQTSNPNDAARMEALGLFDERLETAVMLLNNHRAPSRILTALEEATKDTVQLTSLAYTYKPGFEATLEFSADTAELTSIALQRLELASADLFAEFVMSDIGMTDTEESGAVVRAQFAGILEPSRIAYTGVEARQVPPPISVPVAATTTDTDVPEEITE